VNKPLRKHSEYPRTVKDLKGHVWDIWVLRFRCGSCGRTVSFLPSFCVPHKRHSSQIIALCLHSVLWGGASIRSTFRRYSSSVLSYRGLLQAWLRQWFHNRVVIVQDGFGRLGLSGPFTSPAIQGSSPYVTAECVQCYAACRAFAFSCPIPSDAREVAGAVFVRVQPRLARGYPPLGLFRPSLTPAPG